MGIKYLHVDTYKGLSNNKLEDFGNVNILVGDNNTCKTTFLEAVRLVNGDSEDAFDEVIKNRMADNSSSGYFQGLVDLFREEENMKISLESDSKKVVLKGTVIEELNSETIREYDEETEEYKEVDVHVERTKFIGNLNEKNFERINEQSLFVRRYFRKTKNSSCKFVYSDSHLRTNIINNLITRNIIEDDKIGLTELLKCFDQGIEKIEFVASEYSGAAILKIKHEKKGYISLSNYGDGIKKVLMLAVTIMDIEKDGILLIDEIETSLHVSALDGVFSWLLNVCEERKIQLFISTHSREALGVLTNIGVEREDVDLVVYKLEAYNDEIIVKRIAENKANRILENGGDLR